MRKDLEFLKRRLASAIARGDDPTALRLARQLDQAINGPLAGRCRRVRKVKEDQRKP